MANMRITELSSFIHERYAIHERRSAGLPKPWTQDPILQNYRFCNVYREHDRETIWIAENWRDPNTSDPDVWFAMTVARFVNWSPTLAKIGYPVPWNPSHFVRVIDALVADHQKAFTGAYMIPAGSQKMSKALYLATGVLDPLWADRYRIFESSQSCNIFHKRLMEYNGMGNFLAGQVVCDTKYTRLLNTALDWWEFAVEGPGSKRGLNRVMNRPVNQNWKKHEWNVELALLKTRLGEFILDMPPLHAQDLQNCLCEFDKYERVRLGEGRPRNNYPGGKS